MKAPEIRKKEKVKLLEDVKKMKIELMDKKLMLKMGKEKNTTGLRLLRKDIARINTVLNEKEILNER